MRGSRGSQLSARGGEGVQQLAKRTQGDRHGLGGVGSAPVDILQWGWSGVG